MAGYWLWAMGAVLLVKLLTYIPLHQSGIGIPASDKFRYCMAQYSKLHRKRLKVILLLYLGSSSLSYQLSTEGRKRKQSKGRLGPCYIRFSLVLKNIPLMMIHIRQQRHATSRQCMTDHVVSPIAIYNICRQFLLAWRTNDICDSSVNIWQDRLMSLHANHK